MKNSDGRTTNGDNKGTTTHAPYRKKLTQFYTDVSQALDAAAAFCEGLPEKAHRYNERTLREDELSYSRLAKVSKANHDAQLMEQLATAMNKMTEAKKQAISAHLDSKVSDVFCSLADNLSGDQLFELALGGKDISDPKVMLSAFKSTHLNAKAHRYNEHTLREDELPHSSTEKISQAAHRDALLKELALSSKRMTEARKRSQEDDQYVLIAERLTTAAHLNSKVWDALSCMTNNLSYDQLLEIACEGKDMSDPKVMLSTLKSIHQNAKVHHYNERDLSEDELSGSSAAQVLQANYDVLMEQLTTVNNKMMEAKELADSRAEQMPQANYDALMMEQLVTITNKMIDAKKQVAASHLTDKVWEAFYKALLMEGLDTSTKIMTEVKKSVDSSELKVLKANADTLTKQLAIVKKNSNEAKKVTDSRVAQMSQTNHDAVIIEQLVTAANLNSKICDALSSMTSSLSDNQLLELAFGGKDVSDPKVMLSILKSTHPETVSQANPYTQVMEQSATVNNKMTEAKKLADSRVAQAPKANHDALMVEQLVITTNMTIKAKKLDAAAHLNSKIWDTLTSMANNLSDDQILELTFGGKDMSDAKVVLSVLKSIHQNAKAHSYNESI